MDIRGVGRALSSQAIPAILTSALRSRAGTRPGAVVGVALSRGAPAQAARRQQ